MPTVTASGKVFVHTTIDPTVKDELRRRGIPVGAAAAMWIKQVDKIREENERIKQLESNIEKTQGSLRVEIEHSRQLEEKIRSMEASQQ